MQNNQAEINRIKNNLFMLAIIGSIFGILLLYFIVSFQQFIIFIFLFLASTCVSYFFIFIHIIFAMIMELDFLILLAIKIQAWIINSDPLYDGGKEAFFFYFLIFDIFFILFDIIYCFKAYKMFKYWTQQGLGGGNLI